jgi:carboxyl-terminal processing protease
MNDTPNEPHETTPPSSKERPPVGAAYGPIQSAGLHRSRRDSGSAWLGNVIFFTGTLFGMGLMLLIGEVFPPDEDPDIAHFKEVQQFLLDTHVAELDREELVQYAIKGMFVGLEDVHGDAYSRYYHDGQTVAVDRDTTGQFLGIGVVFRGTSERTQVLFPVQDGPAARAGVRVGDTLLSIDGESLEELATEDVYALLRGVAGQVLQVEVVGLDGQHRHHDIVLQTLTDPSVRHVELIDEARGIGYLAILGFSNETTRQFDAAFEELQAQGMRGLVIDLRGNRGGVLSSAVELAQRFIHQGRITSTEGRGLPEVELARPELAKFVGTPLVVLVDFYSASASEVLAGALQDHRAAVLVGEPTYGKGMVQTITRYPAHEAIAKVTSSFYYTPAHRNLEAHYGHGAEVGLTPDVLIDVSDQTCEQIEAYLHITFSPHPAALAEIRAWERESGEELMPSRPEDAQLAGALLLFSGLHPGSIAQAEDEH